MADTPDLTEDRLLGGRVRLRQPTRGYRAGLDAALLAAALELQPGARAFEAGCGAGGALLQAAGRFPEARFVGLERDAAMAALAMENAALNGWSERITVHAGEVATADLLEHGFDAAFANPPFFDDPAALRGPAPERRGAWLADDGLEAWTRRLLAVVRPGGSVTVVHRADRLADLLSLLSEGGGSLAVRPVHPTAESEAKRVLVRAVKGGRAPLRLLAPLMLHQADGRSTPEAEAILRGEAALPFDPPAKPDSRIHVRAYAARDAEPLIELFRRSVREAAASRYTEAQRLAWAPDHIDLGTFHAARSRRTTWVAEIAGERAGFLDLEDDGHLGMLYVSADHQRRGVASALYRVAEAKALGAGLQRLFVEASHLARPFFEAQGFTVLAEQQVPLRGETLTNFRMEKRLQASA